MSSQSFLAQLDAQAERCNYANYIAEHVTYPPKGLLPLPGRSTSADPGCDVWTPSSTRRLEGSFENIQLAPLYFDREDVKRAIHAPIDVSWSECSNVRVFPRGDGSLPSALSVLPSVIEKGERTVIVHGLADFILIAEGYRAVAHTHFLRERLAGIPNTNPERLFPHRWHGCLGHGPHRKGADFLGSQLSGHMYVPPKPHLCLTHADRFHRLGYRNSLRRSVVKQGVVNTLTIHLRPLSKACSISWASGYSLKDDFVEYFRKQRCICHTDKPAVPKNEHECLSDSPSVSTD
ncbi:alpha/beta-hydrolase [Salix suchowensis]|nr:alpha/beta-hydrolase [Salix suchowensis]